MPICGGGGSGGEGEAQGARGVAAAGMGAAGGAAAGPWRPRGAWQGLGWPWRPSGEAQARLRRGRRPNWAPWLPGWRSRRTLSWAAPASSGCPSRPLAALGWRAGSGGLPQGMAGLQTGRLAGCRLVAGLRLMARLPVGMLHGAQLPLSGAPSCAPSCAQLCAAAPLPPARQIDCLTPKSCSACASACILS